MWRLSVDVCHSLSQSREFGAKFRKISKATELFETRITRMITNLVTLGLISLGQFVPVREIRVVAA
jgi:predicted transcriptional regulator